ncbi:ABC transporter substrate-binding protein [Microbacterium sp. X-17]|uniref:ABC transporter substrate-binding protein n=1 Tax=Microbacterium sp. X-17 TaxID=3144404 RepID=UPI0031F4BF7E
MLKRSLTTVSVLALALIVSACSAPAPAPTSDNGLVSPGPLPTAWPSGYDPNGSLHIGFVAPPRTLDPALSTGIASLEYLTPVYDRLIQIDNNLQLQPMLATDWSFSSDGSTLTMKLRDDITFHDGTPFTADAVVQNITRSKTLDGSLIKASLATVQSVAAVDAHTVKFQLAPGAAGLPSVLSGVAGMMVSPACLSNAALATAVTNCGTGPYQLSAYQPNVSVSYTQAQAPGKFWEPGAGLLHDLTITYIADADAAINGVQSGDLDVAYSIGTNVPKAQSVVASNTSKFQGMMSTLTSQVVLQFNSNIPTMNDKVLRQAAGMAIDRDAINQLYGGTCTPADQPYIAGHWAHDDNLVDQNAYDPAGAKKLLQDAGQTSPHITLSAIAADQLAVQGLQAQLQAVGFQVDIQTLSIPTLISNWAQGQVSTIAGNLAALDYDPSTLFSTYFSNAKGQIAPEYLTQLQPLMQQAGDPTLSQDQRAAVYAKVFTILNQEALVIPICNPSAFWTAPQYVGGLSALFTTSNGAVDTRYLYRQTGQ